MLSFLSKPVKAVSQHYHSVVTTIGLSKDCLRWHHVNNSLFSRKVPVSYNFPEYDQSILIETSSCNQLGIFRTIYSIYSEENCSHGVTAKSLYPFHYAKLQVLLQIGLHQINMCVCMHMTHILTLQWDGLGRRSPSSRAEITCFTSIPGYGWEPAYKSVQT